MPPSQPMIPVRLSGTATDIELGWSAPTDDGGCPITGYKIFRDDGAGGLISIEVDPSSVENKPYLNSYIVTLGSNYTGDVFRF